MLVTQAANIVPPTNIITAIALLFKLGSSQKTLAGPYAKKINKKKKMIPNINSPIFDLFTLFFLLLNIKTILILKNLTFLISGFQKEKRSASF